ncbi:hypothetical protein FACS1894190_15820 [Spirochaetia bacterium]|nr:hypothetical protein FACS1894190_15820 [Spirochaetia bacterium]
MKFIFVSKHVILAVLAVFPVGGVIAQGFDVDKKELQKSQLEIEFENYSGPHSSVNSLNQIRSIGQELARGIRDANGRIRQNVTMGDTSRYSLREVVDQTEKGRSFTESGLAADVIELGARASVDHIRNLRQIIAGYIEEAYGYSIAAADELAVYITVYNVTKRARAEALQGIYSPSVIQYLNNDKIGLSPSYKDWKGKTQIIIPLYDPEDNGKVVIDTATILDEETIAAVEKDNDTTLNAKKAREAKAAADAEKAAAAKKVAEKRAADNAVRTASRKADDDLAMYRRRLADAEQKKIMDGDRLRKTREDLEVKRAEYEAANKDVVRNKFGDPIQGNEGAKAKENEMKLQREAILRYERALKDDDVNIALLKDQLAEAIIQAEEKRLAAQKLDSAN